MLPFIVHQAKQLFYPSNVDAINGMAQARRREAIAFACAASSLVFLTIFMIKFRSQLDNVLRGYPLLVRISVKVTVGLSAVASTASIYALMSLIFLLRKWEIYDRIFPLTDFSLECLENETPADLPPNLPEFDSFNQLPVELKVKILRWVDGVSCASVSKEMRSFYIGNDADPYLGKKYEILYKNVPAILAIIGETKLEDAEIFGLYSYIVHRIGKFDVNKAKQLIRYLKERFEPPSIFGELRLGEAFIWARPFNTYVIYDLVGTDEWKDAARDLARRTLEKALQCIPHLGERASFEASMHSGLDLRSEAIQAYHDEYLGSRTIDPIDMRTVAKAKLDRVAQYGANTYQALSIAVWILAKLNDLDAMGEIVESAYKWRNRGGDDWLYSLNQVVPGALLQILSNQDHSEAIETILKAIEQGLDGQFERNLRFLANAVAQTFMAVNAHEAYGNKAGYYGYLIATFLDGDIASNGEIIPGRNDPLTNALVDFQRSYQDLMQEQAIDLGSAPPATH